MASQSHASDDGESESMGPHPQLPQLTDEERKLMQETAEAMRGHGLNADVRSEAGFVYCETSGMARLNRTVYPRTPRISHTMYDS
jgi:hypothetical protein